MVLQKLTCLRELLKNPLITQKELAGIIGKSEKTIKTRTVEMQEKGLIRRENGKRNGRWEYTTALPADENGLTNPYNGFSYDGYVRELKK